MLRRLNRWLLRLSERRLDRQTSRLAPGRPPLDDPEDGAGVPVEVGPRPRLGGARAFPPAPPES